jgi:hypothetical protein
MSGSDTQQAGPISILPSSISLVSSRPTVEAKGHTGYLTFARKFVASDV